MTITNHRELRTPMTDSRAFLRHTLATIAYRGAKAIRSAGPNFAEYSASETSRTPAKILAHVGDLMDWGLAMSEGRREWHDSTPLASEKPLQVSAEKLFQSALADTLTHIGQIAMLRRMAGVPIKGENYYVADITVGRVGADQAAPRKEFD